MRTDIHVNGIVLASSICTSVDLIPGYKRPVWVLVFAFVLFLFATGLGFGAVRALPTERR